MRANGLTEGEIFRQSVDRVCPGRKVSCSPDLGVVELERMMRELDADGVLVEAQGSLCGVVTRCRLSRLHPADSAGWDRMRVGEVMDTSPVTVQSGFGLFGAMVELVRHDASQLVVIDDTGQPTGLVSRASLDRVAGLSPLLLRRQIEGAESAEEIAEIRLSLCDLVSLSRQADAPVALIVEMVAGLNDACTRRLVDLLAERDGLVVPKGAAYLALGSQGRGEQTLRTDQDSALVYRDDLTAAGLETLREFAARLTAGLERAGIPGCPGLTMASNPYWCQSLSVWRRRLEEWIVEPRSEHMIQFGMFQDLRVVVGEGNLGELLNEAILASVRRHALFFPYMARHIARFTPPLGWFGGFRTEDHGDHRGMLNLKKAGIFALTEGASLLGLEAGITSGTSWEKLENLVAAGILADSDQQVYAEALNILVRFRLDLQLQALQAGKVPTNHLAPETLDETQRRQLREALKGVKSLQRLLRTRYKLNFISR